MAITLLGTATSLAFTQVGSGGPTGPISNIQSYSVSHSDELAEFKMGNARVVGHYGGNKTAAITVESADLGKMVLFKVGQKYDNVTLSIQASKDSTGTAVTGAGDATVTISAAVVTEVGELTMSNENDSPAVMSVTFTMSRHPEDTADPTFAIAADA